MTANSGWRCNFTRYGRGPETEHANPGATLYALDVLRFFPDYRAGVAVVDRAVEFLLNHWEIRKPIGPCHWGIGTLFMQVEYPFLRYNLFFYVYVLSFFERARRDERFQAALAVLESKLNKADDVDLNAGGTFPRPPTIRSNSKYESIRFKFEMVHEDYFRPHETYVTPISDA